MFTGTQAVNAVIGTVTAVDRFVERTYLDPIGIVGTRMDSIRAEQLFGVVEGFDLDRLDGGAPAAAFHLLLVGGEPAAGR